MNRTHATVVLLCGGVVVVMLTQRFASAIQPQIEKQLRDPVNLIKILISPNSKPTLANRGTKYKLPSDYNRNAQEHVDAARRELSGLGTEAFAQLIDHLEDTRYSMTVCSALEPTYFDISVGDVCRDLLFCQIEPIGPWTVGKGRDPRSRPRRPSYFYSHHLYEKDAAERWLADHKKKSLQNIQVEVLQWTISSEKEQPKKYAEDVPHLTATLERLRQADKPLRPRYSGYDPLGHESGR
jgi:hypothetical protein